MIASDKATAGSTSETLATTTTSGATRAMNSDVASVQQDRPFLLYNPSSQGHADRWIIEEQFLVRHHKVPREFCSVRSVPWIVRCRWNASLRIASLKFDLCLIRRLFVSWKTIGVHLRTPIAISHIYGPARPSSKFFLNLWFPLRPRRLRPQKFSSGTRRLTDLLHHKLRHQ